jgi:DNA helicase-2/ATP-dependent DNA helicase PcrA
MQDNFTQLNKAQLDATKQIDGPILILAGAGTGKTKTIVSRLAYLVKEIGIVPSSILTLTFTNKAAKEMRNRAYDIIGQGNLAHPPLLCTFHKFGLLFLKFNIHILGRKNNFIIIDTDDKKRIIKSLDKEIAASECANEISMFKNNLLSPSQAKKQANDELSNQIADVYEKYENYILLNNLVDFDDLLILTYKILEANEEIARATSQRYQYIMVDEYQDTNEIQYKLLRKLCHSHNNLCVVGDDDQSIYGWRGANINNILDFKLQFDDVKIIKLEENYRSTNNILEAANNLIDRNQQRIGKNLISTKGDGKEILILESEHENEESSKIARKINTLIDEGEDAQDIAVLYRVNALSRSLEEGFNKAGLNYKLVGAVRFYERAEIKDIIAYFRLITNHSDDFSFLRIINKPKRGLGKTTIDKLINESKSQKIPIFELVDKLTPEELTAVVGKKNSRTIKYFIASIYDLEDLLGKAPRRFVDSFEDTFEIKESYKKVQDSIDRIANIDEFYGYIRDFIKNAIDDGIFTGLEQFLNDISLKSDQDTIDGHSISLMSVHASKGLEFKHLFVIGLEEGFFPIIGDGCDLEEERRLAYVAITRAKEELTLSYCHKRFYYGKRTDLLKSRFLTETGLVKGSLTIERTNEYKKGDVVKHKVFGMGKIIAVSKAGENYKLKINFGGAKRDILSTFVEKF